MLAVVALPRLKTWVLYAQYEHGRTSLDKVRGPAHSLMGVWEGTFDTIQCGQDERHHFQFSFDTETTGLLVYRFYGERLGGHHAYVYDWRSLIPYDRKRAQTYMANVRVEENNLIIEPSSFFFSPDTLMAAYEIEGKKMRFAFVNERGETPETWGLLMSPPRPPLYEVMRWHW